MPIYEYKCEKCGIVIEKIQKFSDPPLTDCEKCDGKVNKLLSQSSFMLKGSGWYVTDYAKKSSGGESKSETSETKTESKTEAKTEASSETKTEAKAEPTVATTSQTNGSSSSTSGVSTNS